MEETHTINLSKCLFTAADNWVWTAFPFWLIFRFLFLSSLNFFGFIYPLILTVSQFIFWKSQTTPDCVLSTKQGWKEELGVCQELLWFVSLQTGKQWCFPDFFSVSILQYKPLYESDNEIVNVWLFYDKEKTILLK